MCMNIRPEKIKKKRSHSEHFLDHTASSMENDKRKRAFANHQFFARRAILSANISKESKSPNTFLQRKQESKQVYLFNHVKPFVF